MELKLVIDGLGAALEELKQDINDLSLDVITRHNELLSNLDSQETSLDTLMTDVGNIDTKLDAVHTMLSHIADTQAAHGVQLNAIMAAI